MKFFEGFKKDMKKVAVGSAVVAASLVPMKSVEQENTSNTNQDKTEINKEGKSIASMDPEFYRNEYIKYMEHPSYKERLAREIYGDSIITKDMQKIIDIKFTERLKQIKN